MVEKLAWACMAAFGVGSLIFNDYVAHDGSSRMISEVKKIVCQLMEKCIQTNLEELHDAARQ